MYNERDHSLLVRLGKPVRVAALCGVSSQYVSIWRRHGMNGHWRRYLTLIDYLRTHHPSVSQECETMLLQLGEQDKEAA